MVPSNPRMLYEHALRDFGASDDANLADAIPTIIKERQEQGQARWKTMPKYLMPARNEDIHPGSWSPLPEEERTAKAAGMDQSGPLVMRHLRKLEAKQQTAHSI